MGIHVRFIRVMDVVGCHKGDSCFLAQPQKLLVHALLLRQPMVLQLQKIISVPKGVIMPKRRFPCLTVCPAGQVLLDFPGQAGAQDNQPFLISFQHLPVYPGPVIIPFRKATGHNFHQIGISLVIFRQQNQMEIAVLPFHLLPVKPGTGSHIDLAA